MPSSAIKRRNMILQCVWFILTLSFYSVYWFYETCKEMSGGLARQENRPAQPENRDDEVLLWTVLLLIPFAQFYSMYKQGELYENFSGKAVDRWVILLLWSFFPPAVWFLVQRKLNERARARLPAEEPGPG